jgi:hypothetical protein
MYILAQSQAEQQHLVGIQLGKIGLEVTHIRTGKPEVA